MEFAKGRKKRLQELQWLMDASGESLPWRLYPEEDSQPPPEPETEPMEGLEEQAGSSPPPPSPSTPPNANPDPEASQYFDDMAEHYLEAARRLPIAQMPWLADVLSTSTLLVGFNDPVTNIILNAIYMMENSYSHVGVTTDPVRHAADRASYIDIARRSRAALIYFMTFYFRHLTQAQAKLYLRATRHDLALTIALVESHRDGEDKKLFLPVSPDCGRTKTALRHAAQAALLRPGKDYLGPPLASRYPRHLLDPVLNDLRRGEQLSIDSVKDIRSLINQPWSPQPPLPAPTPGTFRDDANGNVTIIVNIGQDLFSTTTITKDLAAAAFTNGSNSLVTTTTISRHQIRAEEDDDLAATASHLSSGSDTESRLRTLLSSTTALQLQVPDTKSLKMCLLDTIHGLYIQALAMLPSGHQPRLLPAVLAGGHCYGVMEDPVSNIVVNTIWYNARFPNSDTDDEDDHDVAMKATHYMARAESSSLHGLIAIVRADRGVTEQEVVACLCNSRRNLSQLMMTMPSSLTHHILAAATEAAKHPQPAALAAFVASLTEEKRDRLRSLLMTKRVLSDAEFTELNIMIAGKDIEAAAPVPRTTAPHPSPSPSQFTPSPLGFAGIGSFRSLLESGTVNTAAPVHRMTTPSPFHPGIFNSVPAAPVNKRKSYVCTKVEELLLDYGRNNPLGPQYKLGVICGVATNKPGPGECSGCHRDTCYHVNFLASTPAAHGDTTSTPECKLFFAEFWAGADVYLQGSKKKPPVCCPIQDYHAFPGRCFICEGGSDAWVRIVHPPCGNYYMGNYVPTDALCAVAEHHANLAQ